VSDDNPFERRQPPSRLTAAQQDRAAGLLVGMAVGDSMARLKPGKARPWHTWTRITHHALSLVQGWSTFPYRKWSGPDWRESLLPVFAHVSGQVLRTLHEVPQEVFRQNYEIGMGAGEDMDFPDLKSMGTCCALWAVMLQHAVLTGEAMLYAGVPFITDEEERYEWTDMISGMEQGVISDVDEAGPFDLLSWSWLAVSVPTVSPRPHRFMEKMRPEYLDEHDALSVASLVGTALGAIHGFSAIPFELRRHLRGDDALHADDLMREAIIAGLGLRPDSGHWPDVEEAGPRHAAPSTTVPHPSDTSVLLSGLGALDRCQNGAVVSLCRIGTKQKPLALERHDHAAFWLVDSEAPEDNPNLAFVLEDAARTVLTLRQEGKTVLLHGLTGESRTPTVAAHYGALISGRPVWEEFQRIARALPQTAPNAGFLSHLASADMRPKEVTEELVAKQAPFGHLAVDRQLIELLSWTIAAELLKKEHMDGWVEPMDGPEDGFVLLLGSTRIEFLRAGAGITLNGEPFMSWTQVVTSGGPHLVVARLEAELGLLFKGCVVVLPLTSSWKAEFAAALVRSGYGSTGSVRVQPLAESEEQRNYLHGALGPRLLCTVDDFSFVVNDHDVIATGMVPLWSAGSDNEGPELAACTVLNTLLEWRRDQDDE
jgi:hypothetical protein